MRTQHFLRIACWNVFIGTAHCIFLFIICIVPPALAQDGPKVMPPSPNAAAFAKFIDAPVSMYTGLVDVNVPIWTVTAGSLNVPISIKYHSGGMQVEQIAAWTGMNWSLQANSMITRSVVGFPDEKSETVHGVNKRGFLYSTDPPLPAPPLNGYHPIYDEFARGLWDGQPDIFYFSVGGFSGKFVLNHQGIPQVAPFQKIKILPPALFLGSASEWRIITPDGTTYFFGQAESTRVSTACTNGVTTQNMDFTNTNYPSSWMLTRMLSATGDEIFFDYADESLSWEQPMSETRNALICADAAGSVGTTELLPPLQRCVSTLTTTGKRLTKIRFPTGVVDFIAGESRLDHGGVTLGAINISSSGTLVKSFQFTYKYLFQDQLKSASQLTNPDPLQVRLFLTRITEKGINNVVGGRYDFTYYLPVGDIAPSRMSLDQDHWGRYNYGGVTRNTTLLPYVRVQDCQGIVRYYGGADRSARLAPSLIGSLKSVQYPTGGSATFTYSLNEWHYRDSLNLVDKTVTLPVLSENVVNTGTQPETEFDIDAAAEVTVSSTNFPIPCFYNNPSCNTSFYGFYLRKRNPDGSYPVPGIAILPNQTYPKTYQLTKGHYKLVHFVSNSSAYASAMHVTTTTPSYYYPYQLKLTWKDASTEPITKIGGLRISEIDEYETVNGKHSVRVFDYIDSIGKSTGFLPSPPIYMPSYIRNRYLVGGLGACLEDRYEAHTANSIAPLGATQGSPVGYSMVTVYRKDKDGNHATGGKSVYKYTTPEDYEDALHPDFPNAPTESVDWARGLLLEEAHYAYIPTPPGMTLIKRKRNFYNVNLDATKPNYTELTGVKVGRVVQGCGLNNPMLATTFYKFRVGYQELARTDEVDFSQGQRVTRRTDYTYSTNHLQLTQVVTTDSKGEVVKQTTKYPSDFASTTTDSDWASATLAKMVAANQLMRPVEQTTYKNNALLSSSLTKYKEYSTGIFKEAEVLNFNTAKPITNAGLATIVSGNLQFEAYTTATGRGYENLITFDAYDASGNPVQYRSRQGDLKAFIWDDLRAFPLAEIANGETTHAAATSFEFNGSGGWTISSAARNGSLSFSGVQSYNLSAGTVSKTGITSARTYIVSFWARSGVPTVSVGAPTAGITREGWTYYEKVFSGATGVTISGTGTIDELRLYPVNARVTTFTYKPLVGVSSIVDPNNTATYFEYDELGRLKFTRNYKGEILKRYTYQYQQR